MMMSLYRRRSLCRRYRTERAGGGCRDIRVGARGYVDFNNSIIIFIHSARLGIIKMGGDIVPPPVISSRRRRRYRTLTASASIIFRNHQDCTTSCYFYTKTAIPKPPTITPSSLSSIQPNSQLSITLTASVSSIFPDHHDCTTSYFYAKTSATQEPPTT